MRMSVSTPDSRLIWSSNIRLSSKSNPSGCALHPQEAASDDLRLADQGDWLADQLPRGPDQMILLAARRRDSAGTASASGAVVVRGRQPGFSGGAVFHRRKQVQTIVLSTMRVCAESWRECDHKLMGSIFAPSK